MRTLLLAGLLAGVVATSASAQDAGVPGPAVRSDRYIFAAAGSVGAGDYSYGPAQSDYDTGSQFTAGYGMDLAAWPNVRVEGSLSYRQQEGETSIDVLGTTYVTDAEITAVTGDVAIYYDFKGAGPVRPYVGAGFGLAGVSLDDGLIDDSTTTANVQLMAGASVELGQRAELFAEGRWQRMGMFSVDATAIGGSDDEKMALSGFSALAGLRVRF